MLSLNINLVFTLINLLVFFLLIKKFLVKPIKNIMDQRQAMIDEQFASAKALEDKALTMKADYERTLSNADEISAQMMEKAKKDAGAEYDHIVSDAQKKAEHLLVDAQKTISVEKEKTVKDLQSEIAALAIAATAKILGDADNTENSQSLYNQFITKAGGSNDANGN